MISKSLLLYGHSGAGKSALVNLLIRALLKKYGQPGAKARIYTAENLRSLQDVVDDGLADAWHINSWDQPFETIRRACDGMWPIEAEDQARGVTAWTKTTIDEFPIRLYEGLATFANYMSGGYAKGGMAERIGRGDSIGPTDSGEAIKLTDGEFSVGGLSRSNFGFAQRRMVDFVQQSQRKPGFTIWTAHEDDAKEKRGAISTGKVILGPEVIGEALTQKIGREFGDCWRLITVPLDVQDKASGELRRIIERRVYVKEHIDPSSECKSVALNSGGLVRQPEISDFYSLTVRDDPKRIGQPRLDVGQILVEKLGL